MEERIRLAMVAQALDRSHIEPESELVDLKQIRDLRAEFTRSQTTVQHLEHGGIRKGGGSKPAVGESAQTVSMPLSFSANVSSVDDAIGRDLYRLVTYFAPRRILEIGTCIGISTLFLLKAAERVTPDYQLITLEGGGTLAEVARSNFVRFGFGAPHVAVHVGPHRDSIIPALRALENVDFAFVDGSHQGSEVIEQHELLLASSSETAIVIYDDVDFWSFDMRRAWQTISNSSSGVSFAINAGRYGICLLDRRWDTKPQVLTRVELENFDQGSVFNA